MTWEETSHSEEHLVDQNGRIVGSVSGGTYDNWHAYDDRVRPSKWLGVYVNRGAAKRAVESAATMPPPTKASECN